MDNNKGLEALAALATAAPSSELSRSANDNQSQVSATAASFGKTSTEGGEDSRNGMNSSQGKVPSLSTANHAMQRATGGLSQVANGTSTGAQQQQQWAQAAGLANTLSAVGITPQHLAMFASMHQQQVPQTDPNLVVLGSQLAYYQYLAQVQSGKTNAAALTPLPSATNDSTKVTQAFFNAMANSNQGQSQGVAGSQGENKTTAPGILQVLPTAPAPASPPSHAQPPANSASTMPPPQATGSTTVSSSQSYRSNSTAGSQLGGTNTVIAPQPQLGADSAYLEDDHGGGNSDKKLQKRAANRRSAQLSRKRKKQFIEELKDENDDLRRKEQILRSIPDLIVVFDSSGKLWFVSQSVSRFLKFSAEDLEGTSFWERLCVDSVRLLKAAFMDSLAARQPHSDTAPLGTGFWELRLVDKDGTQRFVTLNGVVHFAGDRPECVCSIRPRDESSPQATEQHNSSNETFVSNDTASSVRQGSAGTTESLIRVIPQQSVMGNSRYEAESVKLLKDMNGKGREAVRISASGNGSSESESGSSDEMNGRL